MEKLNLLLRFSMCLIICFLLSMVTVSASNYELGDVNTDGNANAEDALMVLKESVKLIELNEYQKIIADVNKDSTIDAEDALQILKVAADLDAFTVQLDLAVGEECVIDRIYDSGSYLWNYELDTTSGIQIEREVKELPPDSEPGDTAEQVYTITAKESGTYELWFKSVHVADKSDIKNEILYTINVID